MNCHLHMETSDFLGGLRPVRHAGAAEDGRLFEWHDGPLVRAMKEEGVFLMDEISLADDSVLERLNRWAVVYSQSCITVVYSRSCTHGCVLSTHSTHSSSITQYITQP